MPRRATSRKLTTGSRRSSIRTRTKTRPPKTNSQKHRPHTKYFRTLKRKRHTMRTVQLHLTKEAGSTPLARRAAVLGPEPEIRLVEALLALAGRAVLVQNSISKTCSARLLEADDGGEAPAAHRSKKRHWSAIISKFRQTYRLWMQRTVSARRYSSHHSSNARRVLVLV